jgi:hypothetical protein
MDPQVKRNKKQNKQKKTFEKYGVFTQKHVRVKEQKKENASNINKPQSKLQNK